jgi:hypothetical protein
MSISIKFIYRYLYSMVLLCSAMFLIAQTPAVREYQIKAVFLFNFTQFVEWPASALPEQSPLIIGILGENPFGGYLDETVSGEEVAGHPLVIQYYMHWQDIKTCHVLFINQNEAKKRQEIMTGLKGRSILTVRDAPDFMQLGGMISFYILNNKIQFQINPESIKASNLTISSKLLRLAQITVPDKNN